MADQTPPARGERRDDRDDDDDLPEGVPGGSRDTWGTTSILLVNLAVGVVMAWAGVPVLMAGAKDVVDFGAVDPVRVWNGDIWRLLSACFVHVGAWHLGLNMWVLWQVGRILERLMGTGRFVLVYLVSGLFGFALSLALQPGLTAGASGAVFGAVGGLLAVAAVARHQALGRFLVGALVPFVLATFAMGFLLPMVNNVAHFGGLVMGFCLGYGLVAGDERVGARGDDGVISHVADTRRRVLGTAGLVLAFVGFTVTTVSAIDPRFSPRFHVTMGLRDLHTLQLRGPTVDEALRQRAFAHVDGAARLGPDDGATLLLRARAAEVAGDADSARRLAAAAFVRFAVDGDRTKAFNATLAELMLLEPAAEMPYVDGFTVRLLCQAALDEEGRGLKAPELKNGCAWLYAMAHETAVRDPALAVALAREAHAEAPDTAAITHTLAVALAESGNAREGLALLERLAVKGDTTLGAAFLLAERQRLGRLVAQQADVAVPAPTASPPEPPEQVPPAPAAAVPVGDEAVAPPP
jgi:membrane associated rhomboid family serine protease